MTQNEIDQDSILMRAYGNNTDILIDRDREAAAHQMCAKYGLAPALLARFQNGLLYRFIPGEVCTPKDLGTEQTWRAVARRLGQWHATLPTSAISSTDAAANGVDGHGHTLVQRKPSPNIWTVMRRWVKALPQGTSKEQTRKAFLEKELERSFEDLDNEEGPGEQGFVVGHCVRSVIHIIHYCFYEHTLSEQSIVTRPSYMPSSRVKCTDKVSIGPAQCECDQDRQCSR